MSVNFGLVKIAQSVLQGITQNKESNDAQTLFPEASRESSENELQDIVTLNAVSFKNNSISKDEIVDFTEQLNDAIENSDKDTIKNILLESNLNSFDILSIMKSNSGKEDWLVQGIKKQFSGKKEDELLKVIADACAEASTSNDEFAKGIADHYVRTMDDITKFYKKINDDESLNISVSTMATGIRG